MIKTQTERKLLEMNISESQKELPGTRVPADPDERVSLLSAATLTTWLGCVAVAVIGFCIPYHRPILKMEIKQPLQAELLKVELTAEALPPVELSTPVALSEPPALKPVSLPQTTPATLVAEPSPSIAFAIPVTGPTRIVDASAASQARVEGAVTEIPAATSPQVLTYGQGEGRQPAPEYPARAQQAGQEGVVGITFTVGYNGRVISAEISSASPWPLLNDSALRTVREKYRFSPAKSRTRVYTIDLRFRISK